MKIFLILFELGVSQMLLRRLNKYNKGIFDIEFPLPNHSCLSAAKISIGHQILSHPLPISLLELSLVISLLFRL